VDDLAHLLEHRRTLKLHCLAQDAMAAKCVFSCNLVLVIFIRAVAFCKGGNFIIAANDYQALTSLARMIYAIPHDG
jgi:hypothetical protein